MYKPSLFSFGELIVDHITIKNDEDIKFLFSQGGGSIWNTLINFVKYGGKSYGYVLTNYDYLSKLVIEELKKNDVEILGRSNQKGHLLKHVHQIIVQKNSEYINHYFTLTCPYCGFRSNSNSYLLSDKKYNELIDILNKLSSLNAIHIDSIIEQRINILNSINSEFRDALIFSVDIGFPNRIKWIPKNELLKKLNIFNYIFMPNTVGNLIKKKFELSNLLEFIDLLPNINSLIITNGEKGLEIYYKDSKKERKITKKIIPQSQKKVVDTAGAGDLLIASFLYQILNKKNYSDVTFEEVVTFLEKSQQEVISKKLRNIGARGHLSVNNTKDVFNRIRNEFDPNKYCYVCLHEKNYLISKVTAFNFYKNIEKIKSILIDAYKKNPLSEWRIFSTLKEPTYVIGTGGSYSTASFISLGILETSEIMTQTLTPFDYIRFVSNNNNVVLVSYSGSTKDIIETFKKAVDNKAKKIIIITGNSKAKILRYVRKEDKAIIIHHKPKERSFVSIIGTLLPVFMYWSYYLRAKKRNEIETIELFKEIYETAKVKVKISISNTFHNTSNVINKLNQNKHIKIIGGGYAWPAMLDLESKIVEGGIGVVEISEMKDFSHGRFMNLIDHDPLIIIFGMPDDLHFRRILVKKLNSLRKKIIILETPYMGLTGSFDLFLQSYSLVSYLVTDKDISKPEFIPKEGIDLYKFEGIYTKKEYK